MSTAGREAAATRVSVVLLNWNAFELTAECLESLRRSTYPVRRILVVDNASVDGSVEKLRIHFPWVQVVPSGTNLGFAGGCNLGIARALAEGADAVWVLNNDTTVDPECLERLVPHLTDSEQVAAVAPRIVYADAPERVWYDGAWLNALTFRAPHRGIGRLKSVDDERKPPEVVDFVSGCSMLIPGRALELVGGFDERFFAYCEDLDWCLRARRAGLRLLYVSEAEIRHKVSASVRRNTLGQSGGFASPRAHHLTIRNTLWVMRRHAERPYQLAAAVALFLAFEIMPTLAGQLVLRRWPKSRAVIRGVVEGLRDESIHTRTEWRLV